VSFGVTGLSVFSPGQLTFHTGSSAVAYDAGLGYTFERGNKRDRRIAVAESLIEVATRNVLDAERQLRFQTEQAFINVLLAKSTLDVTRQDLKTFSDFVDLNQQRVKSGDLAEGDFLPISIQKLQFETDVSAAEVGLVQARAALRQLVGFEAVSDDFDVIGDLAPTTGTVNLEDLKRDALISRPDLLAAQSSLHAAQQGATLERGNAARPVDGSVDYTRVAGVNQLGVGISFELGVNDHNQGNIAKAEIAVHQAEEAEAATRFLVLTDVTSAFAAFQSSVKIVGLYESGYLDQARQSRDITTYAFQRGATNLLSVLDAERTYRDVQLNYRQALAALMTNARQLNFVVGKQVVQ
jgi:cobalt-zinc-cadmium efflux system outer membrane protein